MAICEWCGEYYSYGYDNYCSDKCLEEACSKTCPRCGEKYDARQFLFCPKCEAKEREERNTHRCKECGRTYTGDYNSGYCGDKCERDANAAYIASCVKFPDDAWAEYQKACNLHNNDSYEQAINSYTKAINMGTMMLEINPV